MKYYYIPEIIFSTLVIYFLWSLDTYYALKVIFTAIYGILLVANCIEQWRRARMVGKVKAEKRRHLEQEVNRIKSQQEELVRQEEEKARLKAMEEQEFKQKMQEKKQQDTQKALQEAQDRKKQTVRSEIGRYLPGFINKNFRILADPDYVSLSRLIKQKGLDNRLLFSSSMSEEKLQEMLSDLRGKVSRPLTKLMEMGAEYQENLRNFVNFLNDKGFNIKDDLLQEVIYDEVENKKYQNFKNHFYQEKKGLKYTTDPKDYISAFVEVYGQEVQFRMKHFVRLLEEEIDKNYTLEIINPLIDEELQKRSS